MMREYRVESNGGASVFLMGMACGAAVGAAVALLLAPKSGAELRSDLASHAGDLKRAASETYDDTMGRINKVVEQGRRLAKDGKDALRQAATEVADAGTSAAQRFNG
jgi:gas vesicle protein